MSTKLSPTGRMSGRPNIQSNNPKTDEARAIRTAMVFAPLFKAKKPSPLDGIAGAKPPVYRPAKGRKPRIDPLPALGVDFKETSDE